MDPRFTIADTYKKLQKAGISYKEFEAELNNCDGPDHAIEICYKYQDMADLAKPVA